MRRNSSPALLVVPLILFAVSSGWAVDLKSLDPPVHLPDGEEFKAWEAPIAFARTYHIDASNLQASDDNPGNESRPFTTFNPETLELTWSAAKPIPECPAVDGITHDFFDRPWQAGAVSPGPFTPRTARADVSRTRGAVHTSDGRRRRVRRSAGGAVSLRRESIVGWTSGRTRIAGPAQPHGFPFSSA